MGIRRKRNLGNRAYKISKKLNIPRVTVEMVIREYLDSLTDSALNGENIVINNIMSIKLLKDGDNGGIVARGRVSPVLKNKLQEVEELCENVYENE